jgi:hypothetical protein
MTLVIEDGTNVASANSYDDLTFIRAYNTARGRTLSATDAVVEGQAILAMDYIASLESDMLGFRTFGLEQPLAYPRENVIIGGEYLANNVIPIELKNAEAELVWQIQSGVDLQPTQSGQAVKSRQVGPIRREFFAPATSPILPSVMSWLSVLLIGGTGIGRLHNVRV